MRITKAYKKLNQELHKRNESFGTSAQYTANEVKAIADNLKTIDILDYGCGKGLLKELMGNEYKVKLYDPCVDDFSAQPKPADIVTCFDVLEHVEPECLDDVLKHLAELTKKALLMTIHMGPAMKTLSDGRNAHLIQEKWPFWRSKLLNYFDIDGMDIRGMRNKKSTNKEAIVLLKPKEQISQDKPYRVFIGYDSRQEISYQIARASIEKHCPNVTIEKISVMNTPMKRSGLTPFTYARFMVPYMCDYKGWALFIDADVIARCNVKEIFDKADDQYSVMIAKGGKKFEWAAVMLFNNEKCKHLTPEFIEAGEKLHWISWANDNEIGDVGIEFNFLVGYDDYNPDAKFVHFTQGVPAFPETQGCDFANEWMDVLRWATASRPWAELMGRSVHAEILPDGKVLPKFKVQQMIQQGKLKVVNE